MSLTYRYALTPKEFRRALYFDSFGKKLPQTLFLGGALIVAVIAAIANVFMGVAMTNVMQICYIAIFAMLVLSIISCEMGYHNYKESPLHNCSRSVALSEEWVKFCISGDGESEKYDWHELEGAYETENAFYLYLNSQNVIILPKRYADQEEVALLLYVKLGSRFKKRCLKIAKSECEVA